MESNQKIENIHFRSTITMQSLKICKKAISCGFENFQRFLSFMLYILYNYGNFLTRLVLEMLTHLKKLWGGWVVGWWVYLDYNVSSGPFLSYEIEIVNGPGPELDNSYSYFYVAF